MNTLEYAQVYQQALDEQTVAGATSGWMEVNSSLLKYEGGNEVKIASIIMDGLGDYDRTNGFPMGGVNLSYETFKFAMDRARTFTLDRMDVDETNFSLAAGNVMGTFQRNNVIPEIDSYRYSKIASIALKAGRAETGYTPTDATIWNKLSDHITEIQDEIGDDKTLIITMGIKIAKMLSNTDKISKNLDVTNFKKGEIETRVMSIDGNPIIKVPSSRLFTEYLFRTGKDAQLTGGFEKTADAKPINWIITAMETPIAISKTDKIRIFEPDQNPTADAWKLDYRKYYDLWITKNNVNSIFVSIQ